MKNKKAQGLSLNVIIIAVLALLVLVILAVIFTGKLGTYKPQSDEEQFNEEEDICLDFGGETCIVAERAVV